MKSDSIGTGTSGVEILNVSPHGLWLMVGEKEYFLDFEHFPWFRRATLEQLFRAELLHEDHLYWPDLDVDLDIDRVEHPEKYPLIAQTEDQGEPDGGANRSQPGEPGDSRTSPEAGSGR
jgi:hypothetical protein